MRKEEFPLTKPGRATDWTVQDWALRSNFECFDTKVTLYKKLYISLCSNQFLTTESSTFERVEHILWDA